MVSALNQQIKYAGLSTDTKPTVGVQNGDSFLEMDTGDIYLYDFAGEQWVQQTSGGGGDDNYPYPLLNPEESPFTPNQRGEYRFNTPSLQNEISEEKIKVELDGETYIVEKKSSGDGEPVYIYPSTGSMSNYTWVIGSENRYGYYNVYINFGVDVPQGQHSLQIYTKNEMETVDPGEE